MKIIKIIIIISFLFTNILCNNESEHHHADDELMVFSKNLFGKNLELFFESTFLFVDKTSKIIAHFNFLSNFKQVTFQTVMQDTVIRIY